LRSQIADCDRRLANYRSVINTGGDITVVADRIAETERERRALLAQLGSPINSDTLTTSQVRTLVDAMRDVVETLQDADPVTRPISIGRWAYRCPTTPRTWSAFRCCRVE
jgi:hypothetical protein